MKAYLLDRARDFDFSAGLSPEHDDLIQDLELSSLLGAMAGGDKFVLGVCTKVLLTCLADVAVIRYRQRVLLDCPGDERRGWRERLGLGPRSVHSFTIPPRDEAGGQILGDLTSRGTNQIGRASCRERV